MYVLNDEQVASVEGLIGKLNDSLIKARIEKWLQEVVATERVTTEQLEQFVSFNVHLPAELQNFPQAFAFAVKNTPHTERREEAEDIEETAELTANADDSIAEVPDAEDTMEEDVEQPLHTLGRSKKAVPVKKVKAQKTAKKAKK